LEAAGVYAGPPQALRVASPPRRPRDRAEGSAIQAVMRRVGNLFGWKIAAAREAGLLRRGNAEISCLSDLIGVI
jgi:hypothetical protein